ncbi:MAG TPA: group II intron maturase-specific domain-containing protein [Candidatus Dormibacteraeota bacterium]|nr:group II intron maturase-specific domain-containing protein [Candidatus Dormibacteraeota bacterium]
MPLVGEDQLLAAIAARLGALGLELHPGKTKIVFCKDANRRGDFEHTSFDFLGYTFRGRLAKGRGGYFTGFNPAISATAKKAKGKQIRDWHLNRRSGTDLSGLAKEINPQVQGWIYYYGPSTAPSCASWHGVSTSTSPGGPCTNSNDSAASTPKRWPG